MAIPYPLIMSAMSVAAQQAQQAAEDKKYGRELEVRAYEADLRRDSEREERDLQYALAQLEHEQESERLAMQLAARSESDERQKVVLLEFLATAERIHTQKLEAVRESFLATHDMLRARHKQLIDQQTQLETERIKMEPGPIYEDTVDRIKKIDREIGDCHSVMNSVAENYQKIVSTLKPDLPKQDTLLISG